MASGLDWLMRPVLEKMCTWPQMLDGTLDLEQVLEMNDALDVKAENDRRFHEWAKENPQ